MSFPVARSSHFRVVRCFCRGFCCCQCHVFMQPGNCSPHCKLSAPQPRPECNDSDVLQQRLSWRIYLNPRSGVNHVKSRRCSCHSPTKTGNYLKPQSQPLRHEPSIHPETQCLICLMMTPRCPRRRAFNLDYQSRLPI